jgi:hypothetical protein
VSIYARAVLALLVVLGIAAAWWKLDRMLVASEARGYLRAQTEYQAAAERQREDNRLRSRGSEEKHAAQAEVRERFIVTTVKEVRYATENLASCPVRPDAVRLFNDAAACAREDRPATCGAGQPLPAAR